MNNKTIKDCINQSLEQYFKELGDQEPANLYDMFINNVEKTLLIKIMQHVQHNQSKAAQILGLSRNTLRKKLIIHNLLP